ncbi:Irc21p [Ascoidea rubescens DSM 1968]|uniref:Cytochrome b5 n=1 Tax=Ascoidea rubescens DSM 1968 TaxID=1344418 RepID=A0A1D2VP37_9ASCO|nr:cytochrome b5 [Ascoidea rubescens DSM 1968]ODV63359.1 cytochrome b5 [Ascoidea rubescens DSM 1968]
MVQMELNNTKNDTSSGNNNSGSLFMPVGQRLGILRPSNNYAPTINTSNSQRNNVILNFNDSNKINTFLESNNVNLNANNVNRINNANPQMVNNRLGNNLNVGQRNNNLNVRFSRSSLSVPSLPPPSKSSLSAKRPLPRQKFRVEPGYSQLDWGNLKCSGANLRGIPKDQFPLRVTKLELKKHNKEEDCWICIHNKVYNITSYLKYHPGGVDYLMKCAGKDGTLLFNKYHSWINAERMLDECLVGFYVKE